MNSSAEVFISADKAEEPSSTGNGYGQAIIENHQECGTQLTSCHLDVTGHYINSLHTLGILSQHGTGVNGSLLPFAD